MAINIDDEDWWWLGQLYDVISVFAEDPKVVIVRMGAELCIPEDQANDLHNFKRNLDSKYPQATSLELMKTVSSINEILDRKSRGGEEFDEWFWTNAGFERHPDWARIREIARMFLLR